MYTTTFEWTIMDVNPDNVLNIFKKAKEMGGDNVKMTVKGRFALREKGSGTSAPMYMVVNLSTNWHVVDVECYTKHEIPIFNEKRDASEYLIARSPIDCHFWI